MISSVPSALNHVSVVALDLEESTRFYVDELGLTPLPTPDFGWPVIWLQAGERQLHLFEIDEFMPVYRRMKELGALDHGAFGNAMYELPDGGVQMYVRDPAGNLIELDYRNGAAIPRDEVPEYRRLADVRPQGGEHARATLWHAL
jgi:lactoylglutathione lyase